MIMKQKTKTKLEPARMATLKELLKTTLPAYLAPLPCYDTLRTWFDEARIPRFKPNRRARRGGGSIYYSVAAVEQFFLTRNLPPGSTAKGFPTEEG